MKIGIVNGVSSNPNITWEIIQNNPDYPVEVGYLWISSNIMSIGQAEMDRR